MQAVTITQISAPELEILIENTLRKILGNQPTIPEPNLDQLLTIKQTAEFLSLSVPTIYSLVSKSGIPVSKKGKRLYFSKQELSEWIKAGRRKTNAELTAEASNYVKHKSK